MSQLNSHRTVLRFGCWVLLALWVGVAGSARADGKAFPRTGKAQVEMADQRAVIHFDQDKGIETLIIDTQIQPVAGATAAKVEYAWVVPLPSVPTEVKASTAGALDTLQELTAPDLVMRVEGMGLVGVMFMFALLVSIALLSKRWVVWVAFCFFLLLLLGILVPVLGTASSSGKALAGAVTVHRSESVGAYDTAVLSGTDGAGLTRWLEKNNYPMPASAAPMVAQLAKEGWCFVAMRLRESADGRARPHPMKFVFPIKQAIYPMRLTGVGQVAPLTVDLFVLGQAEATAAGFRSGCAVEVNQAESKDSKPMMWDGSWTTYGFTGENALPVAHPELRDLGQQSKAVTWLHGVVPPPEMTHDVAIGWQPLTPHRDKFYSKQAAGQWGVALALVVLSGVMLMAAISVRAKRRSSSQAVRMVLMGAVVGLGLGAGVYAVFPKPLAALQDEVHPLLASVRRRDLGLGIHQCLEHAENKPIPITAAWIRATLHAHAQEMMGSEERWKQFFIEGDGPNTLSIRDENGSAAVYFYDGIGRELKIWPNANLMQ